MPTIIAAITCIVIGVVGAWIAYRMFSGKGPSVGPFRFVEAISKRKENGMDVMKYRIGLPVSPSSDVVKKILTIRRADTGNGQLEPREVLELDNASTEFVIEAVQDTRVDLELLVEDDSGNRSDPVYMHFTALDTIKPVLTGEMTAEAVGEEAAPAETPAEAPPFGSEPQGRRPGDPAASAEDPDDAAAKDGAEADPETPPAAANPAESPSLN